MDLFFVEVIRNAIKAGVFALIAYLGLKAGKAYRIRKDAKGQKGASN